jgi:DNA-binding transcriptional LysR family regulator
MRLNLPCLGRQLSALVLLRTLLQVSRTGPIFKSISLMSDIYAMNIRTFDLNLLRALHALLETGSVSRAARRLNLTQPATSAALSRLRHALSDALLIREGNRMSMSPLAERLLPRVRLLMADIEETLRDDRFDPRASERAFRIAATDDAIEIIVAPLIAHIRAAAPRVLLEIVSPSEEVGRDLAAGKIDVAIAAEWWLRHVRNRERLFNDRYVGMSRDRRGLTLEEYTSADHVLVAPHGHKPGVVDVALRRQRLVRRVALTVPDFASAARVVSMGGVIATMPSRIARHYAAHYPLLLFEPPLPGLVISLAAHARSMSDPAIAWLVALMKAKGEESPAKATRRPQ